MRIFHVYRSRMRYGTRCGERGPCIFALEAARDPWFWREGAAFRDAVICVGCAATKDRMDLQN